MIDNPADEFKKQLDEAMSHGGGPRAARFALACLGSIPGIGGTIAGIAGAWSEQEQAEYNRIFAAWMKLQEDDLFKLLSVRSLRGTWRAGGDFPSFVAL